jgi:hypothetical protein
MVVLSQFSSPVVCSKKEIREETDERHEQEHISPGQQEHELFFGDGLTALSQIIEQTIVILFTTIFCDL